ncbi:MAG: phosphatidate cytidylyltransferase [Limnochordales bacterium]|nr:phosphatidate cytidylyltransferase [Limnochordales bacterium]
MRARVLTALLGGPLLVAAAVAGHLWWAAVVGLLTAVGLAEWYGLARRGLGVPLPADALFGGGLLVLVVAYIAAEAPVVVPGFGLGAVVFAVVLYALARAASMPVRRPLAAGGAVVLGVLYVAGLFGHFLLLRAVEPLGLGLTLLALVGTWATDSAAFFTGRTLGGRPLAPAISPNKTVSGAVGGWIGGFAVVLLGGVLLAAIPLPRALALAVAIPVFCQAGDLLESALKREAGVKDSGRLLPGHGGILDRFDSLLVVIPAVYYLWLFLGYVF